MMQNKLHIAHGACLVVADYRKALLLRNEGDPDHLNLKVRQVLNVEDGTAATASGVASGRFNKGDRTLAQRFRDDDPGHLNQAEFARRVAGELRAAAETERITDLMIVATPRLLGELRAALDTSTRRLIRAEIDRDLVHQPVWEIERQLAEWPADLAIPR